MPFGPRMSLVLLDGILHQNSAEVQRPNEGTRWGCVPALEAGGADSRMDVGNVHAIWYKDLLVY